jgi:methionyl-tRNA formyltransferase
MKALFMGTPEFACPSLEALARRHEVVSVVTRGDKPSGRGRVLTPPPVKQLALKLGIPVLQPVKINAPETLSVLSVLDPEVVVVAAFGAILRAPLLGLAPHGALNVHASLLPAYRGVAPAPWALIHGLSRTGVTLMQMDEGVDTGPMLGQRAVTVDPGETAGDLLSRLAREGAALLLDVLDDVEAGGVRPQPQPEEGATYAPRLEKEHGYLDLTRSATAVVNQFRGTTPAPGARVFLGDEPILVGAMRAASGSGEEPYMILETGPDHVRVAAGEGAVDLLVLRPPGKPDMSAGAFARGRRLAQGSRFAPPPVIPDLGLKLAPPRKATA